MSVKVAPTALRQNAAPAGVEPGPSQPDPTLGEKIVQRITIMVQDNPTDSQAIDNMKSDTLDLPQGAEDGEEINPNKSGGAESEGVVSEYEKSLAVSNLISFSQEEKHVLRGSPKHHILHRLGSILGNAGGAAWTYMLSQQVEYIDEFFSHNWSVKRWIKSMVLFYHYNRWIACAVTVVASIVLFTLTVNDMTPLVTVQGYTIGVLGTILMVPTFLITFFAAHELQWLTQKVTHTVFLDKTCIHQTDKALQKAGIIKLGAFLGLSRRIVICYTDVYLRKLWTVYEIACFLVMHKISDMTLIHTSFLKLFTAGMLVTYMINFNFVIAGSIEDLVNPGDESTLGLGLFMEFFWGIVIGVGGATLLRVTLRELNQARARVAQFDVHGAMCFCEDDRPLVEGNIDLLLRFHGLIDTEATMEEALQKYNQLVRDSMPPVMDACLGADCIPYSLCVCLGVPWACAHFADDIGRIAREEGAFSFQTVFMIFAMPLTIAFLGLPIIVQTWARALGCCVELRGCKDIAYTLSSAFGILAVKSFFWDQIPGQIIFPNLFYDAEGSYKVGGRVDLVWFGVMMVYMAFYVAYAMFIFRACARRQKKTRAPSLVSTGDQQPPVSAGGTAPAGEVAGEVVGLPSETAKASKEPTQGSSDEGMLVDADGCPLSEV